MYYIFRQESYGAGDQVGNKYWVEISGQYNDRSCREIADELSEKHASAPVMLGGQEFDACELTYLFYDNRRPRSSKDNWVADFIHTVYLDESSIDDDEDCTIKGQPVVIWDTIEDLPRLDQMNNKERLRWMSSLSELERNQLAHVCGLYIGLAIAHPLVLAGNVQALSNLSNFDMHDVFMREIEKQVRRRRKPRRRGRSR